MCNPTATPIFALYDAVRLISSGFSLRQADSVKVQNGWSGESLRRSGSDTLYTGVFRAVVPCSCPLWA